MTRAAEYVSHMYSRFEGRAAVTVGVNSDSDTIHPFVYENSRQIPIGLIAMSTDQSASPVGVDVYHISAFKPGNGQGSEMMAYLCNAADAFGICLSIQAKALSSGGRTLGQLDLVNWYRKFGFKGEGDMYRNPNEQKGSQPA